MTFLRPKDLKDIPLYLDWSSNKNIKLSNNEDITVSEGKVENLGTSGRSYFSKIMKVFSLYDVQSIRKLIDSIYFDTDPDSVDGMSSYEFYIKSPDLENDRYQCNLLKLDSYSSFKIKRNVIRDQLNKIINPIIQNKITPYVQSLYSSNFSKERQCTPCYTFIRRYKNGERISHATHRDGHAFATVVISLSDYEKEYLGGIYVATAERYKYTIKLDRGDALVHKHDLLHGVKIQKEGGERLSLIIWYKDSTDCKDYSKEWFREKAYAGNPIYQSLHANVAPENEIIIWHKKAADGGLSNSMVKLARAYLKLLPSSLKFNAEEAERLYNLAIENTQDPHAQYELSQIILTDMIKNNLNIFERYKKVIHLLEESAKGGNVFAMFNLGIAHLYGYTGEYDSTLAAEWFIESNLPEGFEAASNIFKNKGDKPNFRKYKTMAHKTGYNTPWRIEARNYTGLGGAGGVNLNLPWTTLPNGVKPQKY